MNRSWKNVSNNSSTGFVYFNTSSSTHSPNTSQNSLDTSDFLSFGSDSSPAVSPQGQHFSPSNYSSPRNHNHFHKSPRYHGGRNNFYTPGKRGGGKSWRRNAGLTTPNEQSFNTNSDNRHRQRRIGFQQGSPNESFNTSLFYDPTCLPNPWAELEEDLAQKRKAAISNKEEDTENACEEAEEGESEDSNSSSSEDGSGEMQESFS